MLPQFTRNKGAYVLMREFEDDQMLNSLEKSLEVLIKSHTDFMQITGQLLNSNIQALACMEM